MKKKPLVRRKNHNKTVNYPKDGATVQAWIIFLAKRLAASGLSFENGLQEPYQEAEYLTAFAFSISLELLDSSPNLRAPVDACARMEAIMEQRIVRRIPAAYITREAFFAGHRFMVDQRVLIPRSLIENIFDAEGGFDAWVMLPENPMFLDLCTGSGCLAIALALAYPNARVHAADDSLQALEVARINVESFGLSDRVTLFEADLFRGVPSVRYDMIVTNPPYVSRTTMASLPEEYRHEPTMALDGGVTGLDFVGRILRQAGDYLTPGGVLICEVGDEGEEQIREIWPDFPGEWIWFHFGGSGVFCLERSLFPENIMI
ncbi:MAG: 50S ribosomal protein L3 N(5)-glutamine methyltransferase [Nitrospirae bacterium]|nr:50S ribosomal protein L3 N(5)-glutamine methyltransferase [Magnetococcales bacterium]HAT50806.1 50S ribosomal protein L3 N(5)-glutamine methyltransferase [Alphaproteobacteria bacterium]